MEELIIQNLTSADLELLRELSIQTFVETFADQNKPEDMALAL